MTTTEQDPNNSQLESDLLEANRLDAMYSYAFGYLEGLVAQYLRAIISAEELREDFDHLQVQVSAAVERIMSRPASKQGPGPDVPGEGENPPVRQPGRLLSTRFEDMETTPDHTA